MNNRVFGMFATVMNTCDSASRCRGIEHSSVFRKRHTAGCSSVVGMFTKGL